MESRGRWVVVAVVALAAVAAVGWRLSRPAPPPDLEPDPATPYRHQLPEDPRARAPDADSESFAFVRRPTGGPLPEGFVLEAPDLVDPAKMVPSEEAARRAAGEFEAFLKTPVIQSFIRDFLKRPALASVWNDFKKDQDAQRLALRLRNSTDLRDLMEEYAVKPAFNKALKRYGESPSVHALLRMAPEPRTVPKVQGSPKVISDQPFKGVPVEDDD